MFWQDRLLVKTQTDMYRYHATIKSLDGGKHDLFTHLLYSTFIMDDPQANVSYGHEINDVVLYRMMVHNLNVGMHGDD